MLMDVARVFGAGLSLMGLLAACAGPEVFSRPVYEDPTVLVRLDSPLFKKNRTHAAAGSFTMTATELRTLLHSIKVQRETDFISYYVFRKEPLPEPALTDEELALLIPHLHVALSKARPDETVVFVLDRVDEKGIPRVTSGGLLPRGRQLGFVLANFRTPVTSNAKRARVRDHPLVPQQEIDFRLLAGAHQTVVRTDHEQLLLPEPISVPVLLIHYPALLAEQSIAPPDAASSMPSVSPDPDSALADKLRRLKRWYDEGLITEEEYKKKKQEVLSAF